MQLSGRMCGQGSRCPGYRQTKSARHYNKYVEDVPMPAMDQAVLIEIKQFEADGRTDDPRYEQLLKAGSGGSSSCMPTITASQPPISRRPPSCL